MPNFDGTGPKTGRGLGNCSSKNKTSKNKTLKRSPRRKNSDRKK
jgi:hypothetical protein